jgi:hypothetical protein
VIKFRDSIHLELVMTILKFLCFPRHVALAALLLCAVALAEDGVPNVAGAWTVSVTNGRHSAKQTFIIQQDATKISGTFKGPRQSGTIDGTVAGNNIMFHVTAKIPLDYKGTISGDTTKMNGTFEGDGKTGDWNASRSQ